MTPHGRRRGEPREARHPSQVLPGEGPLRVLRDRVDGRVHPRPELRVDVCSNCHPFFTGKQTIIDTAGQVERFQKRLERQVRT